MSTTSIPDDLQYIEVLVHEDSTAHRRYYGNDPAAALAAWEATPCGIIIGKRSDGAWTLIERRNKPPAATEILVA